MNLQYKCIIIIIIIGVKNALILILLKYEILTEKLNYYGICCVPLAWFAHYQVTNRQQYRKWFEPRSHIIIKSSMIVRVIVVLRRIV